MAAQRAKQTAALSDANALIARRRATLAMLDRLDFDQTRKRFVLKCCTLRERIECADARTAFDGHAELRGECEWLARRLGFQSAPMQIDEIKQGAVTAYMAHFPPVSSGVVIGVLFACIAEKEGNGETDWSGERVLLSDSHRKVICQRLLEWEREAELLDPSSFCPNLTLSNSVCAETAIAIARDGLRCVQIPTNAVHETRSDGTPRVNPATLAPQCASEARRLAITNAYGQFGNASVMVAATTARSLDAKLWPALWQGSVFMQFMGAAKWSDVAAASFIVVGLPHDESAVKAFVALSQVVGASLPAGTALELGLPGIPPPEILWWTYLVKKLACDPHYVYARESSVALCYAFAASVAGMHLLEPAEQSALAPPELKKAQRSQLPRLRRHDRAAFQLRLVCNNQDEIATRLNEQYGTAYKQPAISKMLKRADAYAEAGGLANLQGEPAKRERAADPSMLDMGKRTDARMPRPSDVARACNDAD